MHVAACARGRSSVLTKVYWSRLRTQTLFSFLFFLLLIILVAFEKRNYGSGYLVCACFNSRTNAFPYASIQSSSPCTRLCGLSCCDNHNLLSDGITFRNCRKKGYIKGSSPPDKGPSSKSQQLLACIKAG